ncbi:MAG TPA: hypothetical protein PKE39_03220 [Ignavibacteria bacterium]|nr:hypothetical protein [Ignavibacteria bacterium]HMQ98013.1 hypothetical protein [Ignavibacteria bacterium]
MLQEDEKYKALRDQLRTLPRVKAKQDFEDRLLRRIREAEAPAVKLSGAVSQPVIKHQPARKSWFESLFRPSLVPALGLTVVLLVAVVVYFGYFSKLNQSDTSNTEQFVSSTNQGDLIIYMKKDGEDISSNYPKEYSAVNPEDTRSGDYAPSPTETSTDFFAKPDPGRTIAPELKPDRVSEEQRIEMQRSVDLDKDKGVDVKGERKSDDGIMKKESKSDFKTETKGEMKKDVNQPKKKVSDEKKNILIDEESPNVNQEQKVKDKFEGNLSNEDETGNRISRATKKDSTKNKSESEADEKETIRQK